MLAGKVSQFPTLKQRAHHCNRISADASVNRLSLALTNRCTLRCAYCFQNILNEPRMLWDAIRAAIDLAARQPARTDIIFSGGEPLLEFQLLREAVEYAEAQRAPEKRVRYWLSTNGLLLSSEVADFLQAHQIIVQLSFDGIAAAQDYRGPQTFEILDRLLESLRTEHPDLFQHWLRIAMTVIPPTVRYMADSVAYFLRKGVRELSIAPCITHYPGWQVADIAELDAQIATISDMSRRHLDRTGEVPVKILHKEDGEMLDGHREHRLCGGLRGSSLAVDADGQVYGCPFFAKSCRKLQEVPLMSNLKALRMGDIRDPCFADRRAAAVQTGRGFLPSDWETRCYSSYGKCRDCAHRSRCFVCPVSVWSKPNDTDPFRVPDFICAFNRVVLKYRERFPSIPGPVERLLFRGTPAQNW